MNLNLEHLKEGDRLSYTQYFTVTNINKTGEKLTVTDTNGLTISIGGKDLIERMYSASQYFEEKRGSRTELAEALENAGDAVFTVNFNKLPTYEDFLKLTRGEGGKILSYEEMKKSFKKFKGEERTLVGHLVTTEAKFGRAQVVDLEVPVGEHNLRLVDYRQTNWLILRGVKYIVK